MAHLWPSRVRETTTTTGSGTYTLAGAVTGYRTFASVLSDGDTVDVCIRMGANWEVGRYTFNAGTLARTAVLASSNADAAVDWVAGTKDIFAIHIGFSDLDATGIANLALLVGALGVTGTPTAGQFPQFSGAAQLQALSAAAFLTAVGAMPASYLDTDTALAANSDTKVASQKATKAYVDGLALNLGKRARVRVATTANVTISTALNNGDTLDGVSLVTGDLVLVKDQSSAAQNGVYVVGVSPARAAEFDAWAEFPGSLIAVAEGTANADTLWLCTSNDGGTLDTTALAFTRMVIVGELIAANNLSDVANAATARGNLSAAKKGGWEAVREVTASSGTVASSDAGGLIKMNRATSQTLNIPSNASDPIPVDSAISGQQLGAGVVTIDAPSGVTLNGVDGGNAVVSRRYGGWTLTKIGTNEWTLAGAHYPVT